MYTNNSHEVVGAVKLVPTRYYEKPEEENITFGRDKRLERCLRSRGSKMTGQTYTGENEEKIRL